MNPLISVVSPEYKGSRMVEELVARIKAGESSITEDEMTELYVKGV